MSMLRLALLASAVALVAAVPVAADSNPNKELCKNGGWQTLKRADGSGFENQGDCVGYAAQGGEFGAAVTITGLSPSSIDLGGASVCAIKITGSGFTNPTAVTVNGSPALFFEYVSSSEIKATAPEPVDAGDFVAVETTTGATASVTWTGETLCGPVEA
jgi:hypothetical protein